MPCLKIFTYRKGCKLLLLLLIKYSLTHANMRIIPGQRKLLIKEKEIKILLTTTSITPKEKRCGEGAQYCT